MKCVACKVELDRHGAVDFEACLRKASCSAERMRKRQRETGRTVVSGNRVADEPRPGREFRLGLSEPNFFRRA